MSEAIQLFAGSRIKTSGVGLNAQLTALVAATNPIETWENEDFVAFFDAVSSQMISAKSPVAGLIQEHDLGFIVAWLKKSSIQKMLAIQLEHPLQIQARKERMTFHRPRGIAVHWIAGNVPVLGLLSLIQGLLSRNKNVVKAPKSFGDVLVCLLNFIADVRVQNGEKTLLGSDLLGCLLTVYADRSDIESQTLLSQAADVRIAWGGLEAVKTIAALPRKVNCRDIVFGPKVSFILMTEDAVTKLSVKEAFTLAEGIAKDTFAFGQAGCNAPHNLILHGSPSSFEPFLEYLKVAMRSEAKRNKGVSYNPIDSYNVQERRFLYHVGGGKSVVEGDGFSYTLFVDRDHADIHDPIYCHSLFISYVDDLNQLASVIPENPQTVGLACSEDRRCEIAEMLFNLGVLRVTQVGRMSLYTQPWDGYLPIQEMVKWVSLET